ncbi:MULTISPECIES: metal ABC transporter permease [Thalassospira]|uniref:metal ABC transporter permease n=2 Tax=Thalassospiraceae TaxID=2844866 RepID=UPI00241FA327|nr:MULTISPECIES: metal ABC transporter permease [Thalassospira]MDM7976497.1 metal ABC transporter permease [Thalassospira xiamenensis]
MPQNWRVKALTSGARKSSKRRSNARSLRPPDIRSGPEIAAAESIPAAWARFFARTPEQMAIGAALFGAASVMAGISLSWHIDSPAGPSIVISAAGLFVLSAMMVPILRRFQACWGDQSGIK